MSFLVDWRRVCGRRCREIEGGVSEYGVYCVSAKYKEYSFVITSMEQSLSGMSSIQSQAVGGVPSPHDVWVFLKT